MAKKLATGVRKAAMAGKPSASKRELIDAGKKTTLAKRGGAKAAARNRRG